MNLTIGKTYEEVKTGHFSALKKQIPSTEDSIGTFVRITKTGALVTTTIGATKKRVAKVAIMKITKGRFKAVNIKISESVKSEIKPK